MNNLRVGPDTNFQVLEMLFDPDTGLVDVANKRYGICPEFNKDALDLIEVQLEMTSGQLEFALEKGVKLGLVVKKEKLDKNGKTYTLFYRIDPEYKKDNTEQLRRVADAITRFKTRNTPLT